MCTAVTYRTKDAYFGRNLDLEYSYGEEVTVTPRNFCLSFRDQAPLRRHYAIMGMAHIADGYPLYYDAFNEKGLAVAALNFVHSARYRVPEPGKRNVAHFELIPWLLGGCATVSQARQALQSVRVTSDAFSDSLPPASLHWLLADRKESLTLEATVEGLRYYGGKAGSKGIAAGGQ